MKKSLFFVLLALIFCSCTLDNSVSDALDNSVGTVSFCTDISRGVTASIEYPALLDKTWTLVTTKMDNGGTVGQDTYENFLLTDTLTLSVGSWRFVITDSENKITGAVIATIKAGSNTVSLTVHSTENKGTLSFENCNYLTSKIGQVLYIDLYVDEQRINTPWIASNLTSEDDDYYVLPTFTVQLSEGVHAVRFYYGTDNGGSSSETINVRVVNGMVTHFSLGEQEGNLSVNISFDIQEAIVPN